MLKKKTTIYQLTASLFFNVVVTYAQPVIQSFSPVSGDAGSLVTISGTNFNTALANNIVRFGGTRAQVIASGTNFLTVQVPVGATSNRISVTSNNLIAYSDLSFQFTFPRGGMLFSDNFFAPSVDYKAGVITRSLSLVDFDDDGKPDIATVTPVSGAVSIFPNQSTSGTVLMALPINLIVPGAIFVQDGDFDGDGKIDLCVLKNTGTDDDSLTILKNTSTVGQISFTDAGSFAAGRNPTQACIGDLDGDGRTDLALVSGLDTSVYVLRNTTAGNQISFDAPIRFLARQGPMNATINDIDADGKPELIVVNANGPTNSCTGIFRNTCSPGIISFAARADFFSNNAIEDVQTEDVNSDMKPDIITGGGGLYRNMMLRNTSTGTAFSFSSKSVYVGFVIKGTILNDLNGDGKPDISGGDLMDSSVSVLRNMSTQAEINFPEKTNAYVTGKGPSDLSSGDIDGDGRPDLVVCNRLRGSISILRNLAPSCHLTVDQFPYREDFEASDGHWFAGGSESDWDRGSPVKSILNTAGTGTKCWMTGKLNATYLQDQGSWLRSPCFDFSTLQKPEVSFKLFWDTERNRDGANFQYSLDSGLTWLTVGRTGTGNTCISSNWYNSTSVPSLNVQDGWSGTNQAMPAGCSGGAGSTNWVLARHDLSFLAGEPKVIFRFFFGSNGTCNVLDGFAVDDIRINEAIDQRAKLGNDTTICSGETLILDPGGPFSSYRWQDNSNGPTLNVTLEGTYSVEVTDNVGCVSSDTITVIFECKDIYFASGFTPNKDGLNDVFGPSGDIANISSYAFTVYDRWGQVIYTSANPYERWDGKNKGKELSSQTLVWLAVYTYRDKKYTRKGTVTLIK